MNLPAYLEKHQLTQEQFAKKLGVSQGLVWQWLSGKQTITAERAVEIEKETDGEISKHDLRPDLWERAAA